jgi:hypothetical protein
VPYDFSARRQRFSLSLELDLHYFFFGLHVCSNIALPGVRAKRSFTEPCDVQLHLGITPQSAPTDSEELTYSSPATNATGKPDLRILRIGEGEFVRLAYGDGTDFWLDRRREHVWATWANTSSLENTTSYLLGPVLGLLLRLRGVTCLHASAVAFENQGVAFVGAAGAGKSTTAAAFARQGFGILSDDIVALAEGEDSFQVMPGYPYLSLWPESVKIFHDSPEALPRIVPDWEKRRLALGDDGIRFENRQLRLAAIYFLGDRQLDPAPYVEAIRAQAALLALVANTYANKILDRDLRAREFDVLNRLVETVPIRWIYPHSDSSRIGDLCRIIREDFVSLKATTQPRR